MEMLTMMNIRTAVEQVGSISFSDPMLNDVQHNILWGRLQCRPTCTCPLCQLRFEMHAVSPNLTTFIFEVEREPTMET
jgi:hypothetical protein